MFSLIRDIIGYTGTINNIDSYIIYTCLALVIVGVVVSIDLLYKLLLRFIPNHTK